MPDLAHVLPALRAYEANPMLRPVVEDAFDDIAVAITCTPRLVENWDELPLEDAVRPRNPCESGLFCRRIDV